MLPLYEGGGRGSYHPLHLLLVGCQYTHSRGAPVLRIVSLCPFDTSSPRRARRAATREQAHRASGSGHEAEPFLPVPVNMKDSMEHLFSSGCSSRTHVGIIIDWFRQGIAPSDAWNGERLGLYCHGVGRPRWKALFCNCFLSPFALRSQRIGSGMSPMRVARWGATSGVPGEASEVVTYTLSHSHYHERPRPPD